MHALNLDSPSHLSRSPLRSDLHKIISKNYRRVFSEIESRGTTFPFHLKREFKKYLTCGILAHGFARFHCHSCGADKLVAYSCKGRGVCPSCTGRRMSDTARHLVDEVIPRVPVRQWVLSFPYIHRFVLSSNKDLLRSSLGIYNRLITSFYIKIAKQFKLKNPKVGSITVIQRFGGALNLNVHFHGLFTDGVFYENSEGVEVFKEIIPTDNDIKGLVLKAKIRVNRAFKKRGYLGLNLAEEIQVNETQQESFNLGLIKTESVQNRVGGFSKPRPIGKFKRSEFKEFKSRKCSACEGFSLHANVKILAHQRSALERLCRYISR